RFSEGADRREELLALGGEVDLVTAAIGLAPASFDVSLTFEPVQDRDDSTGADAELLTRSLLADARIVADQPEQARLRGRDTERRERLFEGGGGVGSELSEQEGDAAWAAVRHTHRLHHLQNHSWHVLS